MPAILAERQFAQEYAAKVKEIQQSNASIAESAGKPHADVSKAFAAVYATYPLVPDFTISADGYAQSFSKLDEAIRQEESVKQFVDLRKQIAEKNAALTEATKKMKNTKAAYTALYKSYDQAWTADEGANARLAQILAEMSSLEAKLPTIDDKSLKGIKTPDAIRAALGL